MKLKSLTVKNFRGLRGGDNKISFENSNLIFLIGNNNSGKSTFLHAYEFFLNSRGISNINDFLDKDSSVPIEIIAEFKKEYREGIVYPDWVDLWKDENDIITIKKVWSTPERGYDKYTYKPSEERFVDGGFGGFDTLLTKYAPTPIFVNAIATPEDLEASINEIISKNHIKKLKTQYEDDYNSIVESLAELKNKISEAEEIRNINDKVNELFKSVFPDLTINIYSKPEAGIDIAKTLKSTHGFSIDDSTNNIDLRGNGHGIIRQALFSFLSTNKVDTSSEQYIILYEEPELYLHPETIKILKNELYKLSSKEGYQVLCATHSPSMVDLSKEHSSLVRLTKDSTTKETKTYQVEFNVYQNDERNDLLMNNRFNPYLCEVFYSDEVLIVEGDTEAIIYRELIERYYQGKKNIYILNAGSKSNMIFYQKILTHFGIKHIIIHDCDSKNCIRNGVEQINPMWTYNEKIWEQIIESNSRHESIAKRYVQFKNFEDAHGYVYNTTKGKPYSAYTYAQALEYDNSIPCFEILDDIFGDNIINITQEELLRRSGEVTC